MSDRKPTETKEEGVAEGRGPYFSEEEGGLVFDEEGPGYGVWWGIDEEEEMWIDPDLSGGIARINADGDLEVEAD